MQVAPFYLFDEFLTGKTIYFNRKQKLYYSCWKTTEVFDVCHRASCIYVKTLAFELWLLSKKKSNILLL